jgi:hypothetical protein
MKADLTRFATVEDGVMTCALHAWQWELKTGDCLTSEGHQLYARPVGEPTDDAPGGTTGGKVPDLAALAAATSDVETAAMIAGVERDDD